MNVERWQTLKSLFVEAAALSAEEQQAFLVHLGRSDQQISELLRDLLDPGSGNGPSLNIERPFWSTEQAIGGLPQLLATGQRLLDRFEIVGFLGSGGAAEVYRAFDHQQSVFIAVKTLYCDIASSGVAAARLRRELNTARSVTHPNVCRLYDIHWSPRAENPPFFTMELLEGHTLSHHLRAVGPLPVDVARPLVEQMMDALHAAHRQGIIHRDFKCANVMLTERFTKAVVMDFGLASEFRAGVNLEATLATNQFAGTPAYMPPEQLRGERLTFAADIHSLGVVMFEMVTGRRPFEGSSALEIASLRLNGTAPSPRSYTGNLDRRWEYAIVRCLATEAKERPQSIPDLRRLLNEPPPVLWRRRRILLIGASAASCAGAIGVAAVVHRSHWSPWLETLTLSGSTTPGRNSTAKDHFLRGTTLLQEGTAESTRAAIDLFQRAVQENPRFAEAHAALAEAHSSLLNFGYTIDGGALRRASDCAERAVEADPHLAEAHVALAQVRQLQWNWAAAEASFDEALRLKPAFARARRQRAGLVLQFARFDEALAGMKTAFDQDPFDRSAVAGYGLTLFFAGRLPEAADFLARNIGDRDMASARYNLSQVYARLGSLTTGRDALHYFQLALAEASRLAAIERRAPSTVSELSSRAYALAYILSGRGRAADPFIARLESAVVTGQASPGPLSMIYSCRKQLSRAVEAVEEAARVRDRFVLYLRVHTFLENLRGELRFNAVLRSMRLI